MQLRPCKSVIVVCGPTASGKTALALQLAKRYRTEVLSADSRQFYREIPIGTAQPSPDELAGIPHHFIASRSISEELNAGRFAEEALRLADRLFREHDRIILAGGSGLFIDAFCKGLDDLPRAPAGVRERLNELYRQKGLAPLQKMLREADPVYYEKVDRNNPQRIIRALEVHSSTGKPYSSFLGNRPAQRPFRCVPIAIDMEREELYRRINGRVERMMDDGLLEEARRVYPHRHLKTLETVGYTELFGYLDGKVSLSEAVGLIKRNTRRFAKRQITWLKRDPQVHWVRPEEFHLIPAIIEEAEKN